MILMVAHRHSAEAGHHHIADIFRHPLHSISELFRGLKGKRIKGHGGHFFEDTTGSAMALVAAERKHLLFRSVLDDELLFLRDQLNAAGEKRLSRLQVEELNERIEKLRRDKLQNEGRIVEIHSDIQDQKLHELGRELRKPNLAKSQRENLNKQITVVRKEIEEGRKKIREIEKELSQSVSAKSPSKN